MSQTNTTQIEQQLDVFIDSSFASHLRNEKEAKERKIQEGLDALDAQIGGEITQPFLQKAEHFLNNLESSAYGFAESILEAPEPGLAFLVDEYIQEHPEIDGALFRSKFKERQRQSYFLEKYFVFGKWLTAKVAEELRETQKNIESKVRRTVDAYMEKLVRYEFECLLESHSTSETLLELQDKVAELRNSPADDAELRAELSQCLDGYADTPRPVWLLLGGRKNPGSGSGFCR